MTPSTVPWGEEPGRERSDERCHVTIVDDDVETTAHKVMLIALSPFVKLRLLLVY